ncbi:auxin-responsive protein IAA33 [Euphorbia lathyris]|uniref:auxin-responsive protein IAA33 n=1 Tax=Euphorbia lathyris TaxID=212925 RepID=UPI0033136F26
MNSFDPNCQHIQDQSLKRRWQQSKFNYNNNTLLLPPSSSSLLLQADDDMISTVVPPVTVVLEGRSICQRINLHKHSSYHSLAMALRHMFVDGAAAVSEEYSGDLDLTNAVPGHLVAYEDIENDLLLAGDLNWKDFVRVAKRIRILPVKGTSRKGRREA